MSSTDSGHIAVGMTTTFYTEQPYIAPSSVQAQMLVRAYGAWNPPATAGPSAFVPGRNTLGTAS